MSENEEEKPKIIIDEDWKSQVETEKEAAEQLREESPESDAMSDSATDAVTDAEGLGDFELPPASFAMLVSTIATQAMAALGNLPGPDGKPIHEPKLAKHHIDTLGVLQEKTKGNLTGEEIVMLNNVLHELRMAFVKAEKAPPTS